MIVRHRKPPIVRCDHGNENSITNRGTSHEELSSSENANTTATVTPKTVHIAWTVGGISRYTTCPTMTARPPKITSVELTDGKYVSVDSASIMTAAASTAVRRLGQVGANGTGVTSTSRPRSM